MYSVYSPIHTHTQRVSLLAQSYSEWRQSNIHFPFNFCASNRLEFRIAEMHNAHVPNDVTIVIIFFHNFQTDSIYGSFQYVLETWSKSEISMLFGEIFSVLFGDMECVHCALCRIEWMNEWINLISQLSLGWNISHFNDFSFSFSFLFAMMLCDTLEMFPFSV